MPPKKIEPTEATRMGQKRKPTPVKPSAKTVAAKTVAAKTVAAKTVAAKTVAAKTVAKTTPIKTKPTTKPASKPTSTPTHPAPAPPPETSTLHHPPTSKTSTTLQTLYALICQKKQQPAVQPDATLLLGLSHPLGPHLDLNCDTYSAHDTAALVKFMGMKEVVEGIVAVSIKSAGSCGKHAPNKTVATVANVVKEESKKGGKDAKPGRRGSVAAAPFSLGQNPPVEFIKALCKFFMRASNVANLSVVGVGFAANDWKVVGKGLSVLGNQNNNFQGVTFLRCTLGDNGLVCLGGFLAAVRAKSLRVVDCGLGDGCGGVLGSVVRAHGSRRDGEVWSRGLRGEKSGVNDKSVWGAGVLVLDLSGNMVGDEVARELGEAVGGDRWVLGVNLGGNCIGNKGARAIVEGMRGNETIRALVLTDNVGATQISKEADVRLKELVERNVNRGSVVGCEEDVVVKAMRAWSRWGEKRDKEAEKEEKGKGEEKKEEAAKEVPAAAPTATARAAPVAPAMSTKDAVDGYMVSRDAMNGTAISGDFGAMVAAIVANRKGVGELRVISKPPPKVAQCLATFMVVGGASDKPVGKIAWVDCVAFLKGLKGKGDWGAGWDINNALFAISQKGALAALCKLFERGVKETIKEMGRYSAICQQMASAMGCIHEAYETVLKEKWEGLIKAGGVMRAAFKAQGKTVPWAFVCKTKGGGTKVVTVPSAKAEKEKKVERKVAEKSPRKSPGKTGTSSPGKSPAAEKDKDKLLAQLEGMVDKMTKEISRLETKIATTSVPAAKSPKKKVVGSPERKSVHGNSPGKRQEVADPELMNEISSAVAARLKEIWLIK